MEILLNVADWILGLFADAADELRNFIGFQASLLFAFGLLVFSGFMTFKAKRKYIRVGAVLLAIASLCFLFFVLLVDGMSTRNAI